MFLWLFTSISPYTSGIQVERRLIIKAALGLRGNCRRRSRYHPKCAQVEVFALVSRTPCGIGRPNRDMGKWLSGQMGRRVKKQFTCATDKSQE